MNRRTSFLLPTLALVLIHAAALHGADEKRLVTLVSDPWPPYVFGELGQEATSGAVVDLLNAIFERLDDTRLSIPLVPWNRALREVREGTKDGIGIILKTAEREEYMDYTDVVFNSINLVWYTTDRFPDGFEWEHYVDFETHTIGVVGGHSYGEELDEMFAEGTLTAIKVSSAGQLFAMLEKGRIDLAFADRLVGSAFVSDYAESGTRIAAAEKSPSGEVYYIAFSKKSEARHLIPAVNRAVSELRKEGVIQKLVGDARAAYDDTPDTQTVRK